MIDTIDGQAYCDYAQHKQGLPLLPCKSVFKAGYCQPIDIPGKYGYTLCISNPVSGKEVPHALKPCLHTGKQPLLEHAL